MIRKKPNLKQRIYFFKTGFSPRLYFCYVFFKFKKYCIQHYPIEKEILL